MKDIKKIIKNNKLLFSLFTVIFFMIITLIATIKGAEVIGTTAIGAIITITTVYILGDKKNNADNSSAQHNKKNK